MGIPIPKRQHLLAVLSLNRCYDVGPPIAMSQVKIEEHNPMEMTNAVLILTVGLAAGFLNTVAGGGSLLTMPVLIFLGLPSAVANGTNRVAILFQTANAVFVFRKKGFSDFAYGTMVTVPALAGAWLGAEAAIHMDDRVFNKVLAAVMLLVMGYTFMRPAGRPLAKGEIPAPRRKRETYLSLAAFFLLGIYGGFIQAGIGFLILAALTLVRRCDLVTANAIKVYVVFLYTIVALAAFIWAGKVNWPLGLVLAAGNSAGAWLGGYFAVLKGSRAIQWVLVAAVIVFSIRLFLV
jgi:uncharacterized membrane protein YfcA